MLRSAVPFLRQALQLRAPVTAAAAAAAPAAIAARGYATHVLDNPEYAARDKEIQAAAAASDALFRQEVADRKKLTQSIAKLKRAFDDGKPSDLPKDLLHNIANTLVKYNDRFAVKRFQVYLKEYELEIDEDVRRRMDEFLTRTADDDWFAN
ncbi:hypothetical protein CAOG_04151 [Capsaspora owczarzaki ATCC 30864]|uniref:Uncharacterized protein n=1 Tax=Capsaspora owczarzaki (strain ATCC 30864) TaxID=595528 RepID=A0A0D2X2Y1_CAPO3|nr:hypothetical protein CAOG_04151 [Capsaspora owczarzaki ATCC 30864]KJE93349.1 hypothetical protein CAOG_004151 [Capsaspora owczarzaki ATCC 30864]|eukprot:XP_004347976.1 hypothetical protein CAOG_04151 [Capsaspora owczarzaki ATCC 30864]